MRGHLTVSTSLQSRKTYSSGYYKCGGENKHVNRAVCTSCHGLGRRGQQWLIWGVLRKEEGPSSQLCLTAPALKLLNDFQTSFFPISDSTPPLSANELIAYLKKSSIHHKGLQHPCLLLCCFSSLQGQSLHPGFGSLLPDLLECYAAKDAISYLDSTL